MEAKSIFGSAAGHIGALLVVTIWGTTFVSSKVLLNARLLPADIFFVRFLIAYVCLLAVSHKKIMSDSIADEITMMGLGLMGGSLYFLTENMALVYSTSSNVSILVSSTPLLTAIVVALFYKSERLTRRQIIGSIVAFIGGVLVVLNGQLHLHLNPVGDTLALSAALMWAFYSLLMRRVMGRYTTDFITRKVFFYGIITIIPYFFIFHPLDVSPETWSQPVVIGNVLFLGLIASSGCYLLWNWVMREVGAVHSTNYIYLQSLITMLFGAIILHERITFMGLSGALILIIGMLGALMRRK
ncbi:MAG: DMT family transporter [Prevotella sp.]